MFSYIYQFLVYLINSEMPDIKHIDLYNNQYDNLDESDPIPYPSILIEIEPLDIYQHTQKLQKLDIRINLYLATEFMTGIRANDSQYNKSLEHLLLLDRVFKYIENKCNNDIPDDIKSTQFEIGTLHRNGIELIKGYNSVKITKTSFICKFADASAYPVYTTTNLTDIETTIEII